MLDGLGTGGMECCKKVGSGRSVADLITSLENSTGLRLECAKKLHEGLLVPGLMYRREMERLELGLYN